MHTTHYNNTMRTSRSLSASCLTSYGREPTNDEAERTFHSWNVLDVPLISSAFSSDVADKMAHIQRHHIFLINLQSHGYGFLVRSPWRDAVT